MAFTIPFIFVVVALTHLCANSQSVPLVSILERNFPNHSLVTQISLVNENLIGTIPTKIGLYTNLNRLELDSNELTGTIPSQLGHLSLLDHLHLEENKLQGVIPTEIFSLTRLTELWANQQNLNGTIPSTLGRLKLLESLNFRSNYITGTVPSEVGLLLELNAIRLYDNILTGSLPTQIGRLVKLNRIDMRFNDFTGPFPTNIGNLSDVGYLAFAGRSSAPNYLRMNGSLPSELGTLTKLTYLQMYRQKFSGPLPTELGNLGLLTRMEIYDNRLEGPIPRQLGVIERLRILRLDQNNITSTIPEIFGALNNLERFQLNDNKLQGSIPSELGEMSSLRTLEVGFNELTATIPIELGQLKRLETLGLNNNALTGIIPSELGQLEMIEIFQLNDNFLSNTIPSEIGMLTRLETLHLMMNPNVVGAIPLEVEILTNILNLGDWSFPKGVCTIIPSPYAEAVDQCIETESNGGDVSDAPFFIFIASFSAIIILFGIAVGALIVKNKEKGNRFQLWKITLQTFCAVALNLFDLISDFLFAGSLLRSGDMVSVSFGKLSLLFIFIPMLLNLILVSKFQVKKLRKSEGYRDYVGEHQFSSALYTLLSVFSTEILTVAGAGIWGLNAPITNEDKMKLRAFGIMQTFVEDIPQIIIVIAHAKMIGGEWSNIAIITLATSFVSALFTIIFRTQAFCLLYTGDYKTLDRVDNNDRNVPVHNKNEAPSDKTVVNQEKVPMNSSTFNEQIESLIDMIVAQDPDAENERLSLEVHNITTTQAQKDYNGSITLT